MNQEFLLKLQQKIIKVLEAEAVDLIEVESIASSLGYINCAIDYKIELEPTIFEELKLLYKTLDMYI